MLYLFTYTKDFHTNYALYVNRITNIKKIKKKNILILYPHGKKYKRIE